MLIQLTSLKDVQLQPAPVTTWKLPLTPVCGALSLVGVSVKFEGEPFSVRVKSCAGCEVTVIVPVCEFTQPLGAAVKGTAPVPVPLTEGVGAVAVPVAGVETVIQGALLVAVQLQAVCTTKELVPPATLIVLAAGCSVIEQTVAPCVTGMSIDGLGPVMYIFPCWLVGSVVAGIT
jgi:hypothetical protein